MALVTHNWVDCLARQSGDIEQQQLSFFMESVHILMLSDCCNIFTRLLPLQILSFELAMTGKSPDGKLKNLKKLLESNFSHSGHTFEASMVEDNIKLLSKWPLLSVSVLWLLLISSQKCYLTLDC